MKVIAAIFLGLNEIYQKYWLGGGDKTLNGWNPFFDKSNNFQILYLNYLEKFQNTS